MHPFFFTFPLDQMWRFFIDGYRQESGVLAFDRKDQVWNTQGESGYISHCLASFFVACSTPEPPSAEFICLLHKYALSDVGNTNFTSSARGIHGATVGEFHIREENINFPLSVRFGSAICTLSSEGALELMGYWKVLEETHLPFHYFIPGCVNLADGSSAEESYVIGQLFGYIFSLVSVLDHAGRTSWFAEKGRILPKSLYDALQRTWQRGSFMEMSDDGWSMHTIHRATIPAHIQETIRIYLTQLDAMHSKTDIPVSEKKYTALAILTQFIMELERTHPFADGNCRTICLILLNRELLRLSVIFPEFNFMPAILENPNAFDGFSCAELVREIMKGMERTNLLRATCLPTVRETAPAAGAAAASSAAAATSPRAPTASAAADAAKTVPSPGKPPLSPQKPISPSAPPPMPPPISPHQRPSLPQRQLPPCLTSAPHANGRMPRYKYYTSDRGPFEVNTAQNPEQTRTALEQVKRALAMIPADSPFKYWLHFV